MPKRAITTPNQSFRTAKSLPSNPPSPTKGPDPHALGPCPLQQCTCIPVNVFPGLHAAGRPRSLGRGTAADRGLQCRHACLAAPSPGRGDPLPSETAETGTQTVVGLQKRVGTRRGTPNLEGGTCCVRQDPAAQSAQVGSLVPEPASASVSPHNRPAHSHACRAPPGPAPAQPPLWSHCRVTAKEAAVKQLSYGPQTSSKLTQKLQDKGHGLDDIQEAIQDLERLVSWVWGPQRRPGTWPSR